VKTLDPKVAAAVESMWAELCKTTTPPDLVHVFHAGQWWQWDRRTHEMTPLEEVTL
jgi:hypothetical protein